jgi:hypothetical protein
MPDPKTILTTVRDALAAAEAAGDNWCDAVDSALGRIGVEVDDTATRKADADGHGPLAILADGGEIWDEPHAGALTLYDADGPRIESVPR